MRDTLVFVRRAKSGEQGNRYFKPGERNSLHVICFMNDEVAIYNGGFRMRLGVDAIRLAIMLVKEAGRT
jgi:hypothetical protein